MISRLLLLGLAAPVFAGELTLEPQPFRIEKTYTATAMPAEPVLISLKPESWTSFRIETIAEHGAQVRKGDVVFAFDTEGYDRAVEDKKRALERQRRSLEIAQAGFAKKEADTAAKLTAAKRAKAEADDNLKYFEEVSRPAQEDDIVDGLKKAKFGVEYAQEELDQLQKMYEADDLTEETEEIILIRQKRAVADAKRRLAAVERGSKRTLETSIPRRHLDLQNAAASASTALTHAETTLPLELKNAQIDVAAKRTAFERAEQEFEELLADRELLTIKAPIDGIFFYGSLDNGRWSLGKLADSLKPHGSMPTHRVIASISPANAKLQLDAHVDYALGRVLTQGAVTLVSPKSGDSAAIAGQLMNAGGVPAAGNKDRVTINVDWPEGYSVAAAETFDVRTIVYDRADALAVPKKALTLGADGKTTVTVKSGDTTKAVEVTLGRTSGDEVEILSGLEAGDVIITKD